MALASSFDVLGGMLILKHEDSSKLFGKPPLCWAWSPPSGSCCFESLYFQAAVSKLGPLRLHSSPMSKRSLAGYPLLPHPDFYLPNPKQLQTSSTWRSFTDHKLLDLLANFYRQPETHQTQQLFGDFKNFPYKTWSTWSMVRSVRSTSEVTGNRESSQPSHVGWHAIPVGNPIPSVN